MDALLVRTRVVGAVLARKRVVGALLARIEAMCAESARIETLALLANLIIDSETHFLEDVLSAIITDSVLVDALGGTMTDLS